MYRNSRPNPPPGYRGDSEGDDYPSDDDLEDQDLDILNTDYAAQRELSFHTVHKQPPSQTHYRPTIPPNLRQPETNTYDDSEDRPLSTYQKNGPIPPEMAPMVKSTYDGYNDDRLPQHNATAYQTHRKRRPLIDLIRNEWQNSPYATSSASTSPSIRPTWVQVLTAPRFRRHSLVFFSILTFVWATWYYWAGPQWGEHRRLRHSLTERVKTADGWFGENVRPEFVDMVHLKTLDQDLIPQHANEKRLIVVGDVHGCHDELVNLLAEVQYEARTDHLIFAGDFVSKGPSSPAVVDLAMSAHASCVRGNHEDRVLLAYRDMYSHRMTQEQKKQKIPPPPSPGMPDGMSQNQPTTDDPVVEDQNFEHGDAVDRQLAKNFSKTQIDYMFSCPVILDVGKVKGMGNVRIVHAGLIPGLGLDRQDPMGVMHMRTIDLDTHVPSSSSKGTVWYKLWNGYQSMIAANKRSTVIYGHDSRRGLQLHDYTKGLDTGCVRGGKLTAMIIDGGVKDGQARTVTVDCKDYREFKKGDTE